MWLVAQGKLMTNLERVRRTISDQGNCVACPNGMEDVDHVLRSCDVARSFWRLVLPDVISAPQVQVGFQDWWLGNIGNPKLNPMFGIGAWLLWKRRNRLIFENAAWSVEELSNQSKFWEHLLSSSWKAGQLSREAPGLARQAQMIGWRPADDGWCTLNSDGSLYTRPNRAAVGGLIRDHEGRLISSFAANLGACSIIRAELRGIVEGMRLAWDKGVQKLCIQSDSKAAVSILSNVDNLDHRHASLVEKFQALKNRDWEVSINHIFREANNAADYLAKLGHDLALGVNWGAKQQQRSSVIFDLDCTITRRRHRRSPQTHLHFSAKGAKNNSSNSSRSGVVVDLDCTVHSCTIWTSIRLVDGFSELY
ncbi:Putative ribonuclease H protein At1g65750 [Linum perenne]